VEPPAHMRTSYVRFVPTPRGAVLPVGRLDFIDDQHMSTSTDGELRPQGDGHDAVPDDDDDIKDGGVAPEMEVKPEVEIKRRKMDSGVEVEEVTDHRCNKRL